MEDIQLLVEEECLIELDLVEKGVGEMEEVLVVEGDWYEIFFLKNMLYEDVV